jgi:hypothetical protein
MVSTVSIFSVVAVFSTVMRKAPSWKILARMSRVLFFEGEVIAAAADGSSLVSPVLSSIGHFSGSSISDFFFFILPPGKDLRPSWGFGVFLTSLEGK